MDRWELQFLYSIADDQIDDPITAVSIGCDSKVVLAGKESGQIMMFERNGNGSWSNDYIWQAHTPIPDIRLQRTHSPRITDIDCAQIDRHRPLFISNGINNLKTWIISDAYISTDNSNAIADGFILPQRGETKKTMQANLFSEIKASEGRTISSCRISPDTLQFGYAECNSVFVRHIERPEPRLKVYSDKDPFTAIDWHLQTDDIMLVGNTIGRAAIVDLRIAPYQSTPSMRANSLRLLQKRPLEVLDCEFSPDGRFFYTRHFQDVIIWDYRNVNTPLKVVPLNHFGDHAKHPLQSDANESFKSCWVGDQVLTGSYGDVFFQIGTDGKVVSRFANKTGKDEAKKFIIRSRRQSWAKETRITSIDVSSDMKQVVVAKRGKLFIYDVFRSVKRLYTTPIAKPVLY